MNHNKYDIVIIGSGLGGLACGHILSSEGYRVLVLEREAQPGGCMQSYRRQGLDFDTGLHYIGGLGEGEVLYHPFRMLGLMELPWVKLDADCFDRIHIGGQSFDFVEGYDRFAERLADYFPDEREGLRELVDLFASYNRSQFDMLNPALGCDQQQGVPSSMDLSTPAYQWLHEHFHNDLLINVLSGNTTRCELRKDTLPLYTMAHINSSYIASSWRLRGNGNLLVNKLIDGIRANGGEIKCNSEVTQLIERDGHIVEAQCIDGNSYEADTFISDIHPALTYQLIGESALVKKSMRMRMRLMENTYGMLTVSLVIKPQTLPYVNRNEYVYSRPNLWEGFENDHPVSGVMISYRVPEDGSGHVRQIDLLTPVDWSACSQWTDTKVGRRGDDYAQWKLQKADECISLAETVIPGLRAAIERQYVSTPLTYRDYTLTPNGSAFGLRKDCGNPLLTFLSPRSHEPNLLLTGQSLMVHGVEGVTMTALMTCAEIIGRERIWEKLFNA